MKLAKEEDLRLKKDAKETKEEEQRKLKLANEAEEKRLKIEKEEIDKRLKEAKKEEQELKKAEQKKKKEEKEKEKLSKIAEERQKKLQDEEKQMQMREEKGENLDGNGNQNPFGEEVDEDIRDAAKPQINKDKSEEPIYADEDLMQKALRDKELQKDGSVDQDTDIISVSGDKLTDNMALRPRSPGDAADKNYVSTVSNDEFNEFQQNGYHDEEDIDFTPQNGYLDPEDDAPMPSKGKKSGAPKVDLMGKIAAAGTAIKNARLPSPGEIKEGYLNSSFHKSLHQPLIVKAKVEKSDVQKARQTMTQEKTPLQLGNIESISDIPIPTIRKSKQTDNVDEEKEPSEFSMPKNMDDLGKAVLPKSFFEQNIVTAVKENIDPEELERNRTLTKTKTPAQLAEINSITEFPVPDKLKNLLSSSSKDKEVIPTESKKRRHSDIEPKVEEPFSMYSTLPKSWRETQLVTNVKVEEDEETLRARQDLVNSKSPSELAQITSFSDIPVPSRLSRMVSRNQSVHGSGSKSETRAPRDMSSDQMEVASSTKSMSKVNINDMYATLPKSLTMELAVACKVNANQEEVEKRKKLCQEKTPTELGNIGSLSDIPIPAPIQNLFSRPEAPSKPKRNSKDLTEKRKRNLTTGTVLPSNFLPESWKETKLLVRSRVIDDEDVLKSRQQLVENKTPAELAAISGLSDIPVPTRIQTLMRTKKRNLKSTEEKELSKKVSGSAKSLPDMSGFLSVPSSLRSELIVTAKIEDPEIVARNKEIIKNKSVSELSQIRGLEEFPIPDKIENLFKNQKPKPNPVKMSNSIYDNGVSETSSERPTSPQSFKDSIYGSLPRSMKEQQLLVKSKITDPEKGKERQELVRTKSPAELSQISSITDLPIPAPVENILKRKSEPGSPVAPPRKWKVDDIYESIPGSLKSELIVRSREMEDPEELEKRRELIRTQSPAQLSEINSLADLPIPKFIENKFASKPDSVKNEKTNNDEARDVPLSEKIYGTLPASLMETKLVVKAVCEDPEVQAARAEVVKSKSVNELSQVTSFADIPIPDAIENLMKKKPERNTLAPAERKKKFKDQMKAQSTQSLSQSLYGSLPSSLKQDLLVKARVEDPDVLAERRAVVASKSVSELSQITSLSDFPVPTTLSRAFHKSMERLNGMKSEKPVDVNDSRPISPGARSIQENLYATLPKSLKSEILVKSVVEDPDRQLQNMALTQSKSVSELSQIKSLSDFPIPENIEKLISRSATNNKTETPEQQSLADSRPISQASRRGMNDIYASLPRSLKDQLIVRTKVEENEEVLAQRQALVESKSPVELSEIHSLAEVPIPSRIEAWLHGSNMQQDGSEGVSPMTMPRTKKELTDAVYRTLPTSLVQPCVVRSKVEDPNVLLERQQLQQTKSIHELSKIRNLNEMPIPGNVFKLPDVPLPKAKSILNYIARPPQRSSPRVQNGTRSETYHSYESTQSETPVSTPGTEDKVFANKESPEIDLRYETVPELPPPVEEEEDQFGLADQIRATPERNLRGKKNKKNRRSHEIHEEALSAEAEEVPPPLPPKKLSPSPKKGKSLDKQPSEEEEIEAVPVKNKFRSLGEEVSPHPLPPRRERQSASNEPREITEQEMTFGSNELIYVPGSPLPIMIEEVEEEEEILETPTAPPRSKMSPEK